VLIDVAGGQPGQQPVPRTVAQVIGAAAQHPPDPPQRVVAAAPVPGGLLLHPGGGPHRPRRTPAEPRGRRPALGPRGQAALSAVAYPRNSSSAANSMRPRQSSGLGAHPLRENRSAAAEHDIQQPGRRHVHHCSDVRLACFALARRNAVSSTPSPLTPREPGRAIHQRHAVRPYRRHHRGPGHPNAAATWANECPSWPTPPTRLRTSPLGQRGPRRITGEVSVHVVTGQPGCTHRHTR
jgi:hypothetical protein